MAYDFTTVTTRLTRWFDDMARFELPAWEQLPQLDLYMDQVILLLKQYLSPLCHGEEDKAITASIINNYVRMKLMPPPTKKKYSRIHLASLIIICVLKQSLSISCIQRMLPDAPSETDMQQFYNDFAAQYRTAQTSFIRQLREQYLPAEGQLLTSCAVISTLSTELSEFLLHEEAEEKNRK